MTTDRVQLRRIELCRPPAALTGTFPFAVPSIASLPPLDITTSVTFLVGENGSGKSTLMEGIAVAAALPAVGSQSGDSDSTLSAQRLLAKQIKLTRSSTRDRTASRFSASSSPGWSLAGSTCWMSRRPHCRRRASSA